MISIFSPCSAHRALDLVIISDFVLYLFSHSLFIPQPLRVVKVLFSPMVSGWAGGQLGGQAEGKNCIGCISETIWSRKLIRGGNIGWGVGVQRHSVILI